MTTDFTYCNHGSIIILTAVSAEAAQWVEDHLPEDALTWGPNGTVIEPRYFDDIANGIINDGLSIE